MGLMMITHDLAVVAEHGRPDRGDAPGRGGGAGRDRRSLLARMRAPLHADAVRRLGATASMLPPRAARRPPLLTVRDVGARLSASRAAACSAAPGRFRAVDRVSFAHRRAANASGWSANPAAASRR